MIGVSAVLAAIYAFGWDFPSEVRFFGNSIQANPSAVKLLIWISLGYFFWEYLVHFKDKLTYLRSEWRDRFVQAHKGKVRNYIDTKYDDEALQKLLEKHRKERFDSIHGVQDVQLTNGNHHLLMQEIRVKTLIKMGRDGGFTNISIEEPEQYKAYYASSVLQVLSAWIGCLVTSSQYFEFLLPMLFPLIAVLSAAYGPFPILSGQLAPKTPVL